MARLKNGINGPFSGKVGSVVGCSWKGVNYVRGLPRINKKRTEAQKANQSRFAYVNAWLAPFKPFTSAGLLNYSDRMTWYNAAYNLNHHLLPPAGDTEAVIDYAAMILSDGELKGANEPQLTILPEGVLELSWNNSYGGSTKGNDELLVLLYAAGKKDSDCLISAARRGDGKCRFKCRQDFSGYEAEVFIGFTSADRRKASRSQYLGRVLL